jgi:hypothetical protein
MANIVETLRELPSLFYRTSSTFSFSSTPA